MKSESQRTQRASQRNTETFSSVPSAKSSANSAVKSHARYSLLLIIITGCAIAVVAAQTRRRPRVSKPAPQQQAPRGSATKYSSFLHSSDKHKGLACNGCHKVPTAWTAKRDFPNVADFPDHDSCVRCQRQQFFSWLSVVGA